MPSALVIALLWSWSAPAQVTGQADEFDSLVSPVLTGTCANCHNDRLASGGLNVTGMMSAASLCRAPPAWEKVLQRLRAGDMPPAAVARPAQLPAMIAYIERAFERADATAPADPGRMTAHRLNRNEYTNTIRDLLGVRFRAEKYFPADDSGDGFDNMADLLTVSPLLMERYLAAAERIAAWAMSTAIPAKPIEADYRARDGRIRRLDRSTIEAEHRVEFGGEYAVRFGLPGERPPVNGRDAAPVTLGFWMDGALLATKTVQTKPSGLVYFDPYSEEELKLTLPEGDHVFRAGFIGDEFVTTLPNEAAYDRRKNKFLDSIVFVGPHAPAADKESRRRILTCDPASGRACVEQIVARLARRAYRRPPTAREVDALMRIADLGARTGAPSSGQSAEQGVQLAIQAMLVSPNFLFRIERDPDPRDRTLVHKLSPFELASRLSYFLWSSMPDDELLSLAESGRLRDAQVLAAQVDRMLADPRASEFAANFAGQWLETRNLDSVKPDPDMFKEWTPRAARGDEDRDDDVLRVRAAREPTDHGFPQRVVYLPQRTARDPLRHPGVTGPEFRRVELTTDRRGGVLSHASSAHGVELSDAHVRR